MVCKKCGSNKTVRNGHSTRKGGVKVQVWRCNDCGHVFKEA